MKVAVRYKKGNAMINTSKTVPVLPTSPDIITVVDMKAQLAKVEVIYILSHFTYSTFV